MKPTIPCGSAGPEPALPIARASVRRTRFARLFAHAAHFALGVAFLLPLGATAQQSNIASTKHNLSTTGPGTVKATSQSQICVFCHTPHAANTAAPSPLWNRQLSSATYTPYTSSSLDAETIFGALSQPGGSSKLCLSCHDGTMALGTVGVLGGKTNVSVTLSGTDAGKMPAGPQGETSGFTRKLGIDLRNDHPISFTFNDTLASTDGELRRMDAQQRYPSSTGTVIGIRSSGYKPLLPLQPTGSGGAGQVQCTTCHDPHLNKSKFLRLNRLQTTSGPTGGEFNATTDQICLGCHNKLGTAWSASSHASQTIADESYKDAAATLREFPLGTKVWEAGCLNCHDTHAVQGTRRLLREGVNTATGGSGAGSYMIGSASTPNTVSAIEQTCYQCHNQAAASILNTATGTVPDIKTDFGLTRHMPITTAEQNAGIETHDITDHNFKESRVNLGNTNLNNRHAECTDCHNPHRVTRNSLFNLNGVDQRTHVPGGADGNLASGALRGAFGVEPVYGSRSFFAIPNSYDEKVGDGGVGAITSVASAYVTREYQVCIKCHSDYAYTDDNTYPSGNTRPRLGDNFGATTPSTATERNNYTRYTNQAREFQSPVTHQGAPGNQGTDAGAGYNTGNHRAWHPVMLNTGRTTTLRNGMNANAWLAPWNANVGNQTMYCTDCHGSNASGTTDPRITPDSGVWGPHGSTNDFLLKRPYKTTTGTDDTGLCFRCHDYNRYGAPSDKTAGRTGFATDKTDDGHWIHFNRIRKNLRCNWCHVAVPHGWKNKSFLVNLNDVSAEAGQSGSKEVATNGSSDTYSEGPYYRNAKVKIRTFKQNQQWSASDCGSAGKTGTNLIANSQNGTSNNTNTGIDWMKSTCSNPP